MKKKCKNCGVVKDVLSYHLDDSKTGARMSTCKQCRSVQMKKYWKTKQDIKLNGDNMQDIVLKPEAKCPCFEHSYKWRRENTCTHNVVRDAVNI